MTALLEFLQTAGAFVLGLLVRLLLFVAVLAAVAVPICVIQGGCQWIRHLRARRRRSAVPAI